MKPLGESINCYVCNSGENYDGEDCENINEVNDEIKKKFSVNCSGMGLRGGHPYERCRTFIQDGISKIIL